MFPLLATKALTRGDPLTSPGLGCCSPHPGHHPSTPPSPLLKCLQSTPPGSLCSLLPLLHHSYHLVRGLPFLKGKPIMMLPCVSLHSDFTTALRTKPKVLARAHRGPVIRPHTPNILLSLYPSCAFHSDPRNYQAVPASGPLHVLPLLPGTFFPLLIRLDPVFLPSPG